MNAPPQPALPMAPPAAQAPPIFGQPQQGERPKRKPMTPTFLDPSMTYNPASRGQASLLGA